MYWINCKNFDKHSDIPTDEKVIANFENKEDCLAKIDDIVNGAVRTKRTLRYKDGSARIEFANGRADEYIVGTDENKDINKDEICKRLDRIEEILLKLPEAQKKEVVKQLKEIKVESSPELEKAIKDFKETPAPVESFDSVMAKEAKVEVVEEEKTETTEAEVAETEETEKPKSRKKKAE